MQSRSDYIKGYQQIKSKWRINTHVCHILTDSGCGLSGGSVGAVPECEHVLVRLVLQRLAVHVHVVGGVHQLGVHQLMGWGTRRRRMQELILSAKINYCDYYRT